MWGETGVIHGVEAQSQMLRRRSTSNWKALSVDVCGQCTHTVRRRTAFLVTPLT
jgi:hypothetical protein